MADYAYAQAGNIGSAFGGASPVAVQAPRTVASAIGRIEVLNERLSKAREHLAGLSDQIGGPRPTPEGGKNGGSPTAMGAVGRLNDATEHAHDQMSDIENLLGSIGRALG